MQHGVSHIYIRTCIQHLDRSTVRQQEGLAEQEITCTSEYFLTWGSPSTEFGCKARSLVHKHFTLFSPCRTSFCCCLEIFIFCFLFVCLFLLKYRWFIILHILETTMIFVNQLYLNKEKAITDLIQSFLWLSQIVFSRSKYWSLIATICVFHHEPLGIARNESSQIHKHTNMELSGHT